MKIQDFVRFRDITLIQPQRVKVEIPAFTLPSSAWQGASVVLSQYELNNSYFFTFRRPTKKFGKNFVAAVSFLNEDGVSIRFKLWDDPLAVLYYAVYEGDVIGPNAQIEIWSVNTTDAPTLTIDKVFETSVLVFQTITCQSCCSNPDVTQVLIPSTPVYVPYGQCNPFCDPLLIP